MVRCDLDLITDISSSHIPFLAANVHVCHCFIEAMRKNGIIRHILTTDKSERSERDTINGVQIRAGVISSYMPVHVCHTW